MEFPDAVTLIAKDRDSGLPAENVAIVLILFAAKKNNYTVGPMISNGRGEVRFTRNDCEFSIKRAQEMFVMDYYGDLRSCRPVVEFSLHPPERLDKMQRRYREAPDIWGRGFRDPERLFRQLSTVRNADYEPAVVRARQEQLLANPVLELALVKKSQQQKSGMAALLAAALLGKFYQLLREHQNQS